MRKEADIRGRRAQKERDTLAELSTVAALLVMAVVIAVVAAGGPVLDLLASFPAFGR